MISIRQVYLYLCASIVLLGFQSKSAQAQMQESTYPQIKRWYDQETIYLQNSNSYVKNHVVYTGQNAIRKEFAISEGGMQLYVKSRRKRSIGLVLSLAGSAGTIASLISGNQKTTNKFFWISLGTGLASSFIIMDANNTRDQAVWLRNRDAMLLIDNP
jgi:hypothetical protein